MRRRTLLAAGLTLAARRARAATQPGWRRFELTTHVTLAAASGRADLFLPTMQTRPAYQSAEAPNWQTAGRASLVEDTTYHAPILHARWERAPFDLTMVQRVATHDRAGGDGSSLSDAERRFWTAPADSIPVTGSVRETALRITKGQTTQKARLRAIYDWVIDTTWRNPATRGCGTGDVQTMLTSGHFGGKCADISGLTVALARAAGLPARDVYGIRLAPSGLAASLGKAPDVTAAQHCRAEAFLDGEGWFPIDPADVRKVMLEEHLPIDHPRATRLREALFGTWEMNWAGYNSATGIVLPGGLRPNFPFLMYPCAFTQAGQPDCLDAAGFSYAITVREMM